MKVIEAVKRRQSTRAFLDTPVTREQITRLLESACWSPSGGNLQPWQVHVLMGERMDKFRRLMSEKFAAQPKGEGSEYEVYPPNLKSPYRERRFKCGEDLYAAIEVAREDRPARLRQFAKNYDFFRAPAALFFAIDRDMQQGQWADLGMFMQTLMLLAVDEGLDTCAQESWAIWYRTVGEFLGLPDHHMLFCGMSIGYRDTTHPINRWRTERAGLDEFVSWHDGDDS